MAKKKDGEESQGTQPWSQEREDSWEYTCPACQTARVRNQGQVCWRCTQLN